MKTLKDFYEYIKVPQKWNCVNIILNGNFSKNIFIENYDQFLEFTQNNRNKNCYINYQPLISNTNRKTENVFGVNVLAFDIECLKKKTPETPENMKQLLTYIYKFINYQNITDYMLIESGNGYHLYISIGNVIQSDKEELKLAYKNIIKYFSLYFIKISSGFISSDDRKDLAGILRIPETYNVKAGKSVKIIDIKKGDENILIRKLFFRILHEVRKYNKRISLYSNNNKKQYDKIKLPKNINELIEHPLVRILFDKELPEKKYGSRHSSIIYALQSLIYHSGLQNKYEITQLSREVNIYCGISVDLSSCSDTKDLYHPINCAIRFCKENKYTKYEQELKRLYKNDNKTC